MLGRGVMAVSLAGALFFACSASDGGSPEPASGGGNGATSGGGAPSQGGSGGGWPGAGSGGAAAQAGASGMAGGAGSPIDTDADAPFVCDGTGPLDCSPSQATSYACGDPAPNHATKAKQAVELVLAQHPEWFDTTQGFACCPLAIQPQSFVQAVVDAINADGACAQIDPNNPSIEIVVKTNNKCSEQYVLLTSASIVRNPPKYQGACAPAWL